MADFLRNLLTAGIGGSILIAVVIPLRWLLRRAPKKYICLLWLLAAVRLVLPFQMESNLSLQPDFVQEAPVRIQQSVQSTLQTPVESDPAVTHPATPPEATEPIQTPTVTTPVETPIVNTPVATATPLDLWQLAGWIWSAGVICLVGHSAVSYLRLRRRVRDAVVYADGVWISKLDTAMVLGFFRPRIYLNAGLSPEHRDLVLRHEQCHIRRGDQLWKPLGFLVLALHWCNPLVWVGYWLLCRDLEMACDEAVIRDLDLPQRKSYSAALLACSAHRHAIAACPVAFGEVSVKERIKNVLNFKKPKFWIVLVTIVAIAAVAVCFLTTPKQEDPATRESDWGICVSVGAVTPTGANIYFTQSGALPEDSYWYGNDYTLEQWNGSTWEAVPTLTEAVFTTEARSLNVNGETAISVDWEWLYGQLPEGQYRISKWITSKQGDATCYYAPFTVGVLNHDQILSLFHSAIAQLQAMDSYYEVHEYTIETEFPYLLSFSLHNWYVGGQWYRARENRFTEGTIYYDYMNADGTTYQNAWSDDLADATYDWKVREDFTTENFCQGSVMWRDFTAMEVRSITAEKTENGRVYTIVLLTGATGDATEPVYESYYTFQIDGNANILSIRYYLHGKLYHAAWGRSGYWDTKYDVAITVTPLDPAVLQEKLDSAQAEINQ